MRSSLKFLTILFFIPLFTSAQVYFSEIMYDPKDSDASSGGEWFEVQNTSSVSVDFTKLFFFENDTNHGITAISDSLIPPGGYAVVSKDSTVFKNYFTNFSGLLFKSSFSLNDGEKLAIKNNKEDVATSDNSVEYTSSQGAKNDGNSLQKDSSGTWGPATPTPGVGLTSVGGGSSVSTNNESLEQPPVFSTSNIVSNFPVEPQMIVEAGSNKITVAGALITFDGIALGLKKEPLENARYMWSFGDGILKEGKKVTHTYLYPGEYIAVLEVSSGYFSGSDRLKVLVVKPEIVVSKIGDVTDYFIEITNNSKHELDLSGWILKSQNEQFFIPKNTIITPQGKITFSSLTTRLSFKQNDKPSLLYPSGATAATFGDPVAAEIIKEELIETSNTSAFVEVKEGEEKGFSGKNMAASVALASSGDENAPIKQNQTFPIKWLLSVGVLSALAIFGVMFNARGISGEKSELSADDFEIEEVE